MTGPLAVVAVAGWFAGVIGTVRLMALQYRTWRGAVEPVRGPRLWRETLPIRLPDVVGRSGTFRRMSWRGEADGVVCRAARAWLAVGVCRRRGDGAEFDVRVPLDYLLAMGGAMVFCVAVGAAMLAASDGNPGWADLVPFCLALAVAGQTVVQLRHARRVGQLLARYLVALADELALPPA